MPVIEEIQNNAPQLVELFRDLHAHPELGFEEHRTSKIVAEQLRAFGVDEVESRWGGCRPPQTAS